jgi:hypothetical protein
MGRATALADYLRQLASWREEVWERHYDSSSKQQATFLRAAAAHVESFPDDEPAFLAMEEAGWYRNGEFEPSDSVAEFLKRWGYRTEPVVEDLLFELHCYAGGDEVWQALAKQIKGLAIAKGLRLQPLRPRDTGRPQWDSYQLVTSMGIVQVSGSLPGIRRYFERIDKLSAPGDA